MVDRWVKRSEWAELVVGGGVYNEWKSVSATCAIQASPAYRFRFTASEVTPFARDLAVLRIRPGDAFQLFLAGHLVMSGYVTTRQVYFDAKQHSVELTGVSWEHDLAVASAISKTGQFHDKNWQQMAQEMIKPFGIPLTLLGDKIGSLMKDKFPRASIQPGETVRAFLERYARPLGIQLSANEIGHLVAIAGKMGGQAAVIEGQNIIIGREEITIPEQEPTDVRTKGASPGTNDMWGPDINSILGKGASNLANQFTNRFLPRQIFSEIPAWTQKLAEGRTSTETKHNDLEKIKVTVTVYGWEYTPGALWYRGQEVFVKSPMLMANQAMTAQKVTFTQDGSTGSRTTLELVSENLLHDIGTDVSPAEKKRIVENQTAAWLTLSPDRPFGPGSR